ncbi:Signal recognition particle 9 kDa protein, partial [Lemmus lemmus]
HSRERRRGTGTTPPALEAALWQPPASPSSRRLQAEAPPLAACLLPIGPARPRLTNGVGASASIFVRRSAAPRAVAGGRWAAGDPALLFPQCPRLSLPEAAMPQFQTWEEFSRAAEKLYLADPMKCLVYRTDQAQDVKKIEKFHSQLMRLMVAKESRSVAMETE